MDGGGIIILFVMQLFYALAATLFFILIPAKLFLPDKFLPEKAIIPTWIMVSILIAVVTTSNPPENPDPLNCKETISGLRCD